MSVTHLSGPLMVAAGYQVGTDATPLNVIDSSGNVAVQSALNLPAGAVMSQGGTSPYNANSATQFVGSKLAIADSVATTLFTVNIPNTSQAVILTLLLESSISAASHINDSVRVQTVNIVVVRQAAGIVAVAAISAAVGAQIATTSGGQTLTSAVSVAQAGAAGAANTIAVQVTNVLSVAGISECRWQATLITKSNGPTIS